MLNKDGQLFGKISIIDIIVVVIIIALAIAYTRDILQTATRPRRRRPLLSSMFTR